MSRVVAVVHATAPQKLLWGERVIRDQYAIRGGPLGDTLMGTAYSTGEQQIASGKLSVDQQLRAPVVELSVKQPSVQVVAALPGAKTLMF